MILIISVMQMHAQVKEGLYDNNWVIGDSVRMRFLHPQSKGIIPEYKSNGVTFGENGANVSDSLGNLLFYIGADDLYCYSRIMDKNGVLIPGGDSLKVYNSSTDGMVIINDPGGADKYYVLTPSIFSLSCSTGVSSCLRYSHVDMGMRKVVAKNIPLLCYELNARGYFYLSEKIDAVKHGNGRDWWVYCRRDSANEFIRFLVDDRGIHGPFRQFVGNRLEPPITLSLAGQMTISKDGEKLLLASMTGNIHLLKIDRCTGELYDFKNFSTPSTEIHRVYGNSISPDGTKAYYSYTSNADTTELWQLDLSNNNTKTRIARYPQSRHSTTFLGQHSLGPNGVIYISEPNVNGEPTTLATIQRPDSTGLACSFFPHSIEFTKGLYSAHLPKLPNFNLGPLPFPSASAGRDTALGCRGSTILGTASQPDILYDWQPATGLSDPNAAQPAVDINSFSPGESRQYIVTVVDTSRSCRNTNQDTVIITRLPERGPPAVDAGPDTSICEAAGLFLGKAAVPGFGYRWEGLGLSAADVAQPWARPFVPGMYVLTVSDLGDLCRPVGRDTVEVNFRDPVQRADAGPDIRLCDNLPFEDVIGTEQTAEYVYRWSPVDQVSDPHVAQPQPQVAGRYLLEVVEDSFCLSYDSVEVLPTIPFADAGSDIALCDNQPFSDLLGSEEIQGLYYRWQPEAGLSDASLARPEVSLPGRYVLTVSRDSICTSQDSVIVSLTTCTDIILPNAISPNGDGINEAFYITNLPPGSSLTIWHRWGKIAWQSATYQQNFRADGLPEGVYAAVLTLPDGEVVTGTVMVLR
ncbi:MAG: gliding motility-associated C-terminal domain-containing protein [Bacteroidia bacterium]